MNKLIEDYESMNFDIQNRMSIHEADTKEMLVSMELSYRCGVLETLRGFSMSACDAVSKGQVGFHYHLLMEFMNQLSQERKFGLKADEKGQKKRDTALAAFLSILQDGQRKFGGDAEYSGAVDAFICTVLPAWIQFRQTYIEI